MMIKENHFVILRILMVDSGISISHPISSPPFRRQGVRKGKG
jgi:hypothetical protein